MEEVIPDNAHGDLQNLTHLTPSLKLMAASKFLMAVLAPLDILYVSGSLPLFHLDPYLKKKEKRNPTKAI